MDIVGPLPISDGYRYCFTLIDRFSRWAEAIPLKNVEAITIYRAFIYGWISRYGTPETLTTNQGSQFELQIFSSLLKLSGCHRIRTTAYHPASNGMVERWHRTLMAAIKCHTGQQWTNVLSTVLLGLRSNVLDSGSSLAEYLYGTTLKIPGEFILPEEFTPDPQIFLEEFRELMRSVKPTSVEHRHKRKIFVHKDLYSCSHVFLKIGTIKKSLDCPYSGPHKVLSRISDRVFEIEINGDKRRVSVENVKPAFFVSPELSSTNNLSSNHSSNLSSLAVCTPDVNINTSSQFQVQKPLRTYVNKKKVTFNLSKNN